jgi:PKD repeat protein
MKKILLLGLGLIVLVFTIGCGQKSVETSNHSSGIIAQGTTGRAAPATFAPAPMITVTSAAFAPAPMTTIASAAKNPPFAMDAPYPTPSPVYFGAAGSVSNNSTNLNTSTDRMVVRTGNLQIVVNQISVALDSINQVAARYGGYVVNSQQWKEGDRNIGSISIRVLAENYDKALADLRSIAKSVTSEATTSQDVTEEYTDLDSQVKNLQATEAQLLKIMDNATKTEDVLNIQHELTTVRGQIEQMKGRMIYLERTSATSLINVNLEEAVLALKFSAAKVSAGSDEEIKFTSEVIGGFAPYNYAWDFGDGKTSAEASPSHSYKDSGTFSVALKVTDDKGYTNTLARDGYINIISSWKPGGVASSAWSGFMKFGKGLVNVLIWLGIFSFVWIPVGAIVWYLAFYRRKKKQAN